MSGKKGNQSLREQYHMLYIRTRIYEGLWISSLSKRENIDSKSCNWGMAEGQSMYNNDR